jgi:protein-S-isoprenylcysteine O-methyltransferase Ste14
MGMLLRQLASFLALPFMVAIVVPVWLASRWEIVPRAPAGLAELAAVVAGLVILAVGVTLFAACLHRFATEGRGTLAPWDPPRRLVVRGPYRFVRNPMISGVIFVLLGEALLLRSIPHLVWAVVFVALNATFIPLVEEPQLATRFGDDYRRYCEHVPRFLPRVRPWTP